MRLILATRRSALALAQSRAFARALEAAVAGLTVDELQIVTSGDRTQDKPLQDIGGKGLFIKELEEALLDGRAHFAVHSIKDVPAVLAPGLALACVPSREDPRDALVTRTGQKLAELSPGARVGTSSLRRAVSILAVRPDLRAEPGARQRRHAPPQGGKRRVRRGGAGAGRAQAARLGRSGHRDPLGRGLAPRHRSGRAGHRVPRRRRGDARRAGPPRRSRELDLRRRGARVMAAVDGSCRLPVAAYAVHVGGEIFLRGMLADPDGSNLRRGERRAAFPAGAAGAEAIGRDLGDELKRRHDGGGPQTPAQG